MSKDFLQRALVNRYHKEFTFKELRLKVPIASFKLSKMSGVDARSTRHADLVGVPKITEISMIRLLKALNQELRRVGFLNEGDLDFTPDDLVGFVPWEPAKHRTPWGEKKKEEESKGEENKE